MLCLKLVTWFRFSVYVRARDVQCFRLGVVVVSLNYEDVCVRLPTVF